MLAFCFRRLRRVPRLVSVTILSMVICVVFAWLPQIVGGRPSETQWEPTRATPSRSGVGWWITVSKRLGHTEIASASDADAHIVALDNPASREMLDSLNLLESPAPYWSRAAQNITLEDLKDNALVADVSRSVYESASGWPLRAFMWQVDLTNDGTPGTLTAGAVVRRVQANSSYRYTSPLNQVILPLGCIWSGFAANCLVYALVMLSCLMASDAFVYCRRTRANRCMWCSYPRIGTDSTCPECGHNFRDQVSRSRAREQERSRKRS